MISRVRENSFERDDRAASELPLLARRGGCGNKKNREASATPQTGWWFNKFSSNLDHHPASHRYGGFAASFYGCSSPLLARRGNSLATAIHSHLHRPHVLRGINE